MTTTNLTPAQIDSGLLFHGTASGPKWSGNAITFSVPGPQSTWDLAAYSDPAVYGTGEPLDAYYSTLSSSQGANFSYGMSLWDSYIAPALVQVADDGTSYGSIRVAFVDVAARTGNDSYAYAGAPPNQGGTATPVSGDIWIAKVHVIETFDPGTFGFQTLLHETGHTLGLKHTFSPTPLATGPNGESYDNYAHSIMSYSAADYRLDFTLYPGGGWSIGSSQVNDTTPMVLDIQAIQDLYGADTTTHAGNDTYTFTDSQFLSRSALYDAGGTDTLDFSQISRASHIDLRPGALSDVNYYSKAQQEDYVFANTAESQHERLHSFIFDNSFYQWTNNLGISFSTTIENVIGTGQADTIVGNAVGNVITGGAGADTMAGGGGNDVFRDTAANLNGDTITDFTNADVVNVSDAGGALVGLTYTGDVLSYALASDPATVYSMTVQGASGPVHQRYDAGRGTDIYFGNSTENGAADVPCYCTGTLIRTDGGEVPVETLKAADRVVTASGAIRPIKWIGHRTVHCGTVAKPDQVLPVRFRAGSLAPCVPVRDLLVSPDHALFFDEVLIPAKCLINGSTVRQVEVDTVTYYAIELDSHDMVIAEGVASESFYDDGQRNRFDNYAGDGSELDPTRALTREGSYRPLVMEGRRVAAIRAWIDSRAEQLGRPPVHGISGTSADADAAEVDTSVVGPRIEGCLERVSREQICGWAWMPERPNDAVVLELVLDGEVVGVFAADEYRVDLHFARFGHGRHAFRFRLPPAAYAREWTHVGVRVRSSGMHLSHSPVVLASTDAEELSLV